MCKSLKALPFYFFLLWLHGKLTLMGGGDKETSKAISYEFFCSRYEPHYAGDFFRPDRTEQVIVQLDDNCVLRS